MAYLIGRWEMSRSNGGMIWQGKTEELGEKPVPVPLCPPQIPGLRAERPAINRMSHGTVLWKHQWTIFTYFSEESKRMSRLFKVTNIKTAFRAKHRLPQGTLKITFRSMQLQWSLSMIMTRLCVGQTRRAIKVIYREHTQTIKTKLETCKTYFWDGTVKWSSWRFDGNIA
jgi:hypothetical protein